MPDTLKKIRTLRIRFSGDLAGHEIPAFRGAIAAKVGHENVLFHNHLGKDSFSYRYPLIQYKNLSGQPGIVCIELGVDEIHKFFQHKDWSLSLSGRKLDMKIENLSLNQFTMQVWDKMFDYRIHNWVALNQQNYTKYLTLPDEEARQEMLTAILKGNILSFAKGIEWNVSKPIELKIQSPLIPRQVKVKGTNVTAFNLNFSTNIFLPSYIGLGKSVSLGYGVVMNSGKRMNNQSNKQS
ncbi:MAG: CRISPR-associated endonuclease Cas6 [Bacteroidales bacterium]